MSPMAAVSQLIDNDSLKMLAEADPEELSVDRSTLLLHMKQIGKSKELNKWVCARLEEN